MQMIKKFSYLDPAKMDDFRTGIEPHFDLPRYTLVLPCPTNIILKDLLTSN